MFGTNYLYNWQQCIVIVYDCTKRASYNNVSEWMLQVQKNSSRYECLVLVANKIDQENKIILDSEGKQLAEHFNMSFFEVSALTGENINELFTHCATVMLENKSKRKNTNSFCLNSSNHTKKEILKKNKGC